MSDIARIFSGCKNPEHIDQFLKGLRAGARIRTLIDMRKEVEKLPERSWLTEDERTKVISKQEVLNLIKKMINEST